MELTDLIKAMKANGLISIKRFTFRGKVSAIENMTKVMSGTTEQEKDAGWWTVRAFVLATDKDRNDCMSKLSLADQMTERRN